MKGRCPLVARCVLPVVRCLVAGLIPIAVAAAPAFAQQMPEQARARIQAFVQALSTGTPGQFEAMAQEHYAPGLLAKRTANERQAMARRVQSEVGTLEIVAEAVTAPGRVEIEARGSRGPLLRLRFEFQPAAPHKIIAVALEAEPREQGRGREGGPAPLPRPDVNPAMASPDIARTLDAYLAKLAGANEFAGVVLVARNGTRIFEKAYGVADHARQTPMTPELRFNIASIGKAFTKVAIGQLVAAGKLALGDTIGRLLPDYPNAQARGATVDQLLTHRAGIPDFFGPRFNAAPKSQFRRNADYFRFIADQPLLFPPGTQNQYCNGCYIVLGQIIEKVTGMPYERYIAERVFGPARMTGAGFLAYGDPGVAPGYARIDGKLVANDTSQGRHGSAAGGAFARASDLLAFDNALRERRLLDAKMTAWYLEVAPVPTGRFPGEYGIAGGTRGANADLEATGTWTVVVTGNLDPPNATRVATAIMRSLREP